MRIQTLVTLAAGAVGAIVVGAGTAGVVMRANSSTVIQTAAEDTSCPVKDIRVVDRHEGLGAGWYELDVCGAATRYRRTKTIFHRADQHPDSLLLNPPAPPASVPGPAPAPPAERILPPRS